MQPPPGMPGGEPGGFGGGSGSDASAALGAASFRTPQNAVVSFLAALKSKNKDRLAQTAQTTIVCTLLVGAISGGMYVYYKLQSKLEDKKHEQRLAEIEAELNPKK